MSSPSDPALTPVNTDEFSDHPQKDISDRGVGGAKIKNKETTNYRAFEYTGGAVGGCGPAGPAKYESEPVHTG